MNCSTFQSFHIEPGAESFRVQLEFRGEKQLSVALA